MENFEFFLNGLRLNNPYMYAENMSDKKVGKIYHYTSPNGFESILFKDEEKVTLWASRYDCLNDMSEGTIAIKIYKETCEDLLKSKEITKEQYDEIANLEANKKEFTSYKSYNIKTYLTERVEHQKYICSFSINQDSLAMWNYYTKGNKYEGYNIGFNSLEIKCAMNRFFGTGRSGRLYPVIYHKIEQKQLIKKFLLDILKYYPTEDKKTIKYEISKQLLDWSLIFKSEYFEHEHEVRVIISIPKDSLEDVKKTSPLDIKYRNNYGYIIPYIELSFEKNCVSDVCIGPIQYNDEQKETQKKILHERLNTNGYVLAELIYSKIPIRY
ncbi:DUF2971 domain-containing protein [Clostridium sp. UBA7503]|uniref:DUF2971 domain-containing protein n=1 Tax=Clostridium sp. UBA7503 TaxID=1946377 RepID=UPI00321674DF